MIYGTTAAPFLALRVLRQLVLDEGSQHSKGSIIINDQTYIDDCLFGADSKDKIIENREDVKNLLKKGHFQLRKWASNSPSLLEDIDSLEHGLAVEKSLDESDSLKVLGIVWHPSDGGNASTRHHDTSAHHEEDSWCVKRK